MKPDNRQAFAALCFALSATVFFGPQLHVPPLIRALLVTVQLLLAISVIRAGIRLIEGD